MARIPIFQSIQEGLSQAMGFTWMSYILIGLALLGAVLIVMNIDPIIGFIFVATPFITYTMFASLSVSWALSATAVFVGFALFASLYRLFSGRT